MTGKQLRQFRQQVGLTQKQLAQKVGVSEFTLRRWELEMSKPSPLAQEKLANVCSLIYLRQTSKAIVEGSIAQILKENELVKG